MEESIMQESQYKTYLMQRLEGILKEAQEAKKLCLNEINQIEGNENVIGKRSYDKELKGLQKKLDELKARVSPDMDFIIRYIRLQDEIEITRNALLLCKSILEDDSETSEK